VVPTVFGRRFARRIWLLSGIVFAGVFMVNASQAEAVDPAVLIKGAVPALIAALCYPIGDQLVQEAEAGRGGLADIRSP
jgi:drug/metabolite transporter (DMT)-like permease